MEWVWLFGLFFLGATAQLSAGWATWSGPANEYNWRANMNPADVRLNSRELSGLRQLWNFTGGPMSTNPTSTGDLYLYIPDWAGMLRAFNRLTGQVLWSFNVSAFLSQHYPTANVSEFYMSRSAPVLVGERLYLATRAAAVVLCLNRFDGVLLWQTKVEQHPAAVITASPMYHDGLVYVGVSSDEETWATLPGYVCCSMRGSEVALDALTGRLIWQFYTVPPGFAGGAIWGSQPPVDVKRNTLYISTGNLYHAPAYVRACVNATANITSLLRDPCRAPGEYTEAVLSLDLKTGRLVWATLLGRLDTWIGSCGVSLLGIQFLAPTANCPPHAGNDTDFGESPIFLPGASDAECFPSFRHGIPYTDDLLSVGQKSGVNWLLTAESGLILNSSVLSPGGSFGGLIWGSASNGTTMFFVAANSDSQPYVLQNGQTITTSYWGALDLATNRILWQTPDVWVGPQLGLLAMPVTYVATGNGQGLVMTGSYDLLAATGARLTILDPNTGTILYQHAFGNRVLGGISAFDGKLYFATGYNPLAGFSSGTLYALAPSAL